MRNEIAKPGGMHFTGELLLRKTLSEYDVSQSPEVKPIRNKGKPETSDEFPEGVIRCLAVCFGNHQTTAGLEHAMDFRETPPGIRPMLDRSDADGGVKGFIAKRDRQGIALLK